MFYHYVTRFLIFCCGNILFRSWLEKSRSERRKSYNNNKPFNDLWIRRETPRWACTLWFNIYDMTLLLYAFTYTCFKCCMIYKCIMGRNMTYNYVYYYILPSPGWRHLCHFILANISDF